MIKQTLCFTNQAFLSLKNSQLVIDTKSDRGVLTRPIEDIGVIVLESREVTLTTALLSTLVDHNIAVMVCDEKHLPSGLLLPLNAHSLMTEISRSQVNVSVPLKKQLWQNTIVSKISNQSKLLKKRNVQVGCMEQWAKMVRSGDPDNLEARAAVYYWKNIFRDNPDFKRGEEDFYENSLLNYGYAILRGVIARSLVGAGLIPHLGLFHSNKYNPYCLADDVMEPYRPYVDELVISILEETGRGNSLTSKIKKELLKIPVIDVNIGRLRRPLMIAATITASSLADCFKGEKRKISYPEMQ